MNTTHPFLQDWVLGKFMNNNDYLNKTELFDVKVIVNNKFLKKYMGDKMEKTFVKAHDNGTMQFGINLALRIMVKEGDEWVEKYLIVTRAEGDAFFSHYRPPVGNPATRVRYNVTSFRTPFVQVYEGKK